jgi:hypothetical protein
MARTPSPPNLPDQLQCKLRVTRFAETKARCRAAVERLCKLAKAGAGKGRVGIRPVRPIQQVEDLGAEFYRDPLGDVRGLEDGKVYRAEPRTINRIAADGGGRLPPLIRLEIVIQQLTARRRVNARIIVSSPIRRGK